MKNKLLIVIFCLGITQQQLFGSDQGLKTENESLSEWQHKLFIENMNVPLVSTKVDDEFPNDKASAANRVSNQLIMGTVFAFVGALLIGGLGAAIFPGDGNATEPGLPSGFGLAIPGYCISSYVGVNLIGKRSGTRANEWATFGTAVGLFATGVLLAYYEDPRYAGIMTLAPVGCTITYNLTLK